MNGVAAGREQHAAVFAGVRRGPGFHGGRELLEEDEAVEVGQFFDCLAEFRGCHGRPRLHEGLKRSVQLENLLSTLQALKVHFQPQNP